MLTIIILPLITFAQTELPKSYRIKPETTQAELDEIVAGLQSNKIKLELETITFNKKGTKLISLKGTLLYNDIDKTGFAFEAYKIESISIKTATDGKMGITIKARDSKSHPLSLD